MPVLSPPTIKAATPSPVEPQALALKPKAAVILVVLNPHTLNPKTPKTLRP